MKTRSSTALLTPFPLPGTAACDVDQTEATERPDVEVEEGNMLQYDVEGGAGERSP